MKLFDFQCKNTECAHLFEDLVNTDEPNPPCPECQQETDKILFCNDPTAPHSPKMAEMRMKWNAIQDKINGKVPWRKNSYSQSGNE